MNKKQIQITNLILHTVVFIMGFIAVAIQFNTNEANNAVSFSGWHVFRFFTNDGNIFCMVVSLINVIYITYSMVKGKDDFPKWLYLLNLMSTVSGLLIFFTVLLVLWPTLGPLLFVGYLMIVLHVSNPILVSLSFLLTMHYDVKKREGIYGMVPMAIYGIPVLILILAKVWTGDLIPYPFLEVYDNPWWVSIFVVIGMFGGCALVGMLLTILTKKLNIENAPKKKLLVTGIVVLSVIIAIAALVITLNIMY